MYPLLCAGGYPVPSKPGVLEVIAVSASPIVVGQAMKAVLRDDTDNYSADYTVDPNKNEIVHLETDGDGTQSISFDPPLKTRRGIMPTTLTNAVCHVYVR